MIPADGFILGLVIDLCSLQMNSSYHWRKLEGLYEVLYMERYEEDRSILLWRAEDAMAVTLPYPEDPSESSEFTLEKASEILDVEKERICVVSGDRFFCHALLHQPCVTFEVGEEPGFHEAHRLTDFYVEEEKLLIRALFFDAGYYMGEAAIRKRRYMQQLPCTRLYSYGFRFPLYICGRYFPAGHFLSQKDPYTKALRRIMNGEGAESVEEMVKDAVSWICERHQIEAILSIPPKPEERSKFSRLISHVAEYCEIENLDPAVFCSRKYPSLFSLTEKERRDAVLDAFQTREGYDYKKRILIFDDNVSTGATFEEMAQVLLWEGTKEMIFLALGISQEPVKAIKREN